MTSQHNTGTHPFYIGMYIHICTHIYVHIYTSQKECLCIFHIHQLIVTYISQAVLSASKNTWNHYQSGPAKLASNALYEQTTFDQQNPRSLAAFSVGMVSGLRA